MESAKGERLQEESNHKRIVEDLRKQIEDANSQKEKALEESRKKHLIEVNEVEGLLVRGQNSHFSSISPPLAEFPPRKAHDSKGRMANALHGKARD